MTSRSACPQDLAHSSSGLHAGEREREREREREKRGEGGRERCNGQYYSQFTRLNSLHLLPFPPSPLSLSLLSSSSPLTLSSFLSFSSHSRFSLSLLFLSPRGAWRESLHLPICRFISVSTVAPASATMSCPVIPVVGRWSGEEMEMVHNSKVFCVRERERKRMKREREEREEREREKERERRERDETTKTTTKTPTPYIYTTHPCPRCPRRRSAQCPRPGERPR